MWSDRDHGAWEDARRGIASAECGDAWWHGVSRADLLTFARRMADTLGIRGEVTGARVVRYTNAATGYPTLRLDVIYRPLAARLTGSG